MSDDWTSWLDEPEIDPDPIGDEPPIDLEVDLPDLSIDPELGFTEPPAESTFNIEADDLPDLSAELGTELGSPGVSEPMIHTAGPSTAASEPPRPAPPPWMADVRTADPAAAPALAPPDQRGEYPRLSTRRGALREGPGVG